MNKTTSQKIMLLMYNKQYYYTLSVSLIPLLLTSFNNPTKYSAHIFSMTGLN